MPPLQGQERAVAQAPELRSERPLGVPARRQTHHRTPPVPEQEPPVGRQERGQRLGQVLAQAEHDANAGDRQERAPVRPGRQLAVRPRIPEQGQAAW